MAFRRIFRVTLAFLPLTAAAACLPQPPRTTATATIKSSDVQPRTATYNCTGGGMMTIENLGTSVRILGPDGASEELPASPANQNSRFGREHDAVVIDGRDALVMKSGQTPLACKR